MAEDDDLIEVAGEIADGTPVDWRAVEAHATTPDARDRIRWLERLAGIGRLHAGLTHPRPDETSLHDSIRPTSADRGGESAPVRWGPLTIIEKIGHGTFGDVYRARESRLDRDVALKLLRHKDAGAATSSDVIEEARLMARVRHPNVTTIYGAERISGRVGLWMEFIDGRTLEDELRDRGPFGVDDLRRVGADVAAALSAVHRAGLLHRDVKAHNVMRAGDGRLLLTDFGTGRPLEAQGGELVDELAGSPLYLAPEVLAGAPATVQSDIYSLGVLLYRLATRSFPVRGKSLQELRAAHAAARRPRLCDERRDLPAGLAGAIDRALAADPAARHATAEAFAVALAPEPASPRRSWLVWMSLAATCVVAAWAAWLANRQLPPSGPVPAFVEQRVLIGPDAAGAIAVSPDGRWMAYVDDATGNLGVQDLATGDRRLVTASGSWDKQTHTNTATFSRDSRRLAYSWTELINKEFHYEVRLIDVDRPREAPPIYVNAEDAWLAPYDWSPDARLIAVGLGGGDGDQIALVDVNGGAPRVLKSLDWRGTPRVSFSPDGRYLAYDAPPDASTAQRDVFVISTDGREHHAVVAGPSRDHLSGWSPDGQYVLVTSDRRGSMSLWGQPVRAGEARGDPVLLKPDIRQEVLGVTTDGRVFYTVATSDQTIVVATVDLDTGTLLAPLSMPVISGLFNHRRAKWSPDARSFAYISTTASNNPSLPTQRILSIQSTDTGQVRIMPMKLARWWTCSWATDGRSLLAHAMDFKARLGIFRIDAATGDATPLLLNDGETYYSQPQWAADSRRFYYVRGPDPFNASDKDVFVERDLASGSDREVFRNQDLKRQDGTAAPPIRDWVVSPDGRRVGGIETAGDYHAVWVLTMGERTVRQVFRVQMPNRCCNLPITHNALLWTPDGQALIVNAGVPNQADARELWVVPVAEGQTPRKLDIGGARLRNDAPAVSPDGRQVAFQAGDDPVYEIRALKFVLPGGR
jgi:serine/threonine-protein kinase